MKLPARRTLTLLFTHLAALLAFLTAGLAFYAPAPGALTTLYFGAGDDPVAFVWFLNWFPHAASHHLPLFTTQLIDAPFGTSLAWTTNSVALAILGSPLIAVLGALTFYNLLMLLAPGLAAWGAYLAASELSRSLTAALAAGLIFGFSSYELSQLLGHLNLAFTAAVPLCLWACLAAASQAWPAWRLALTLGALLGFEFGISQEVCATLCLFGALTLGLIHQSSLSGRVAVRRLGPGIGGALVIAGLISAPELFAMALSTSTFSGATAAPADLSQDLLGFIIPTPIDWLGSLAALPLSARFPGNYAEEGGYLGLPLLILVSMIAWRHRATPAFRLAALMGLAAAILALGPYLHLAGVQISTAPWVLVSNLPVFRAMMPARFMLYAWLAIAMLLALWLGAPGKRTRFALLAACLIPLLPWQKFDRNWQPLAIPAIFTDGTIPNGAHILILPERGEELGFQYAGGLKFTLVGQGYTGGGLPQPFAQAPFFRALLDNHFADIPPKDFAAYLAQYGVQIAVVTTEHYYDFDTQTRLNGATAAAAARQLLQAAGWRLTRQTPDAALFAPPAS